MRLLLTTMLVFAVVGTSSNVIPLMQPRFVSHQPLRLSWTAQNSNRSHTTLREHNTQTTEPYPRLQRLVTMRWGTFLLWNYMMLSNTTQILAHLTSMRWIYILGIWQLAWGRMHSSLTKLEYGREFEYYVIILNILTRSTMVASYAFLIGALTYNMTGVKMHLLRQVS